MTSIIRATDYQNVDGTAAISPHTNGYLRTKIQGWTFEERGGSIYPVGKTKVSYVATGADQTLVVPSGVTWIFAKLWGAGGGGGSTGGWTYGAEGGGGGHTRGLISVTPGESLRLVVGVGGRTASNAAVYGGGGVARNGDDLRYGGQGGGGTYIFRSSTRLLIAGGGGGGGSSRAWLGNIGGAGGGLTGQRGQSPYDSKQNFGGGGGSQTAGGDSVGIAGTLYQGGQPNVNNYGGGGGGGFYGGGGGGYSESNTMAGGGGGSGFVDSAALVSGTFTGSYRRPAFYWDEDLNTTGATGTTLSAFGGPAAQNNNPGPGSASGGNGFIVIYY